MKCPNCQYDPTMSEIQRSPADCVNCGIHYDAFYKEQAAKAAHAASAPEVAGALANYPGARPVVVMDINMSFSSMVRFMVKWAIAAVPAIIILVIIATIVFSVLTGVISSYSKYSSINSSKVVEPNSASYVKSSEPIFTPGPRQGNFWLEDLRFEGRRAISTIREKTSSGFQYSLLVVDCRNGIAAVMSSSIDRSALFNDPRVELTKIPVGSDLQSISIRLCRDYPDRHPSL